ncbi:hypothetical protein GF358_03740 [Candidatus Woesearchaeota archaeon]|nr:hypothetical protein [Candidatus Woesearchaeota archaeon]
MGRLIKQILHKIKEPKVLVSLFLASIMIFSVLGFMMSYQMEGNTTEIEYNGYVFEQLYDGVRTRIHGESITLTYFPEQVDQINISKAAKIALENLPVFSITYETDSTYTEYFAGQQFELSENMEKIEKYAIPGMMNNTGYKSIPKITCNNATASVPVILFQESNTTGIKFNNNCIIANIGNMNDVYRVGDLLFYTMAGVIE